MSLRIAIILSFGLLFVVPLSPSEALAQARRGNAPGNTPASNKANAQAAGEVSSYVLGPEDVVRVVVEDYPQFSHESVPVLPNGSIILPVYGTLSVTGKSIKQVEVELRGRLGKRMRSPRLSLSLVTPRAVYAFVVGAVKAPGKVKISANDRVVDVLESAGGAMGRPEDLIASLKRGSQAPTSVNIKAALAQPLSAANLPVRANDTLTVRLVPKYVYVVGAVKTPGKLPMTTDDFRLTDLLAAAGGPQGQLDELQATLTRAKQPPMPVDLHEAVLHPLSAVNFKVQPDDTLTVRLAPRYVYVVGAVKTAGKLPMTTAEFRLTDALMAAGGVVGRLEQMQTTLTRVGQAPLAVDLDAAVSKPTSPANVLLQSNDTLTVVEQEAPRINIIGDVLKPGIYELYRSPRPNANELPLTARVADAVKSAGGLKYSVDVPVGFAEQEFTGSIVRKGQEIPVRVEDALEGKDETANISLQPGDMLSIKAVPPLTVVVDGAVRSPGKVQLPPRASVLDAVVKANGLTRAPDKIAATIWRNGKTVPFNLSKALLSDDPTVNPPLQENDVLQLNEPQTIQVQMTGKSAKVGSVRLPLNASLFDAIVQSGGLAEKPDVLRINVLRNASDGSWSNLSIDPIKLFEQDAKANLRLQDGDFIEINPKGQKRTVFIRGEVAKQGSYEVDEDETLDKLILRAGGPTNEAALTKISVRRNDAIQTVDVREALLEGAKVNFTLQEGDFIVVPPIAERVMVMEAVARPGSYPMPEKGDLTLFDAVTLAGGLRPDAKKWEVTLLRKNAAGAVEKRVFSLDILKTGEQDSKEILKNGDVVVVPARTSNPNLLQKITGVVSSVINPFSILGRIP